MEIILRKENKIKVKSKNEVYYGIYKVQKFNPSTIDLVMDQLISRTFNSQGKLDVKWAQDYFDGQKDKIYESWTPVRGQNCNHSLFFRLEEYVRQTGPKN